MSAPTQSRRSRTMLESFGPLITLILLIIATAVCQRLRGGSSTFLSLENFRNILANWSFVGIIALGMTFIIISGGIDLSVGSLVAFAGGAGIWMMNTAIDAARIRQEYSDAGQSNLPVPYSAFRAGLAQLMISLHLAGSERAGVIIAVVVTLFIGILAGIINGLLVVRARIAPFIATLGGLAAYRSLAMAMIDGGTFDSKSPDLFHRIAGSGIAIPGLHVGVDRPLIVPYPVFVFFFLAVVMSVLLNKMRFGDIFMRSAAMSGPRGIRV